MIVSCVVLNQGLEIYYQWLCLADAGVKGV